MNFITKITRHELVTGSFYLFFGGLVGSLLSFIFNLFLARTLSYSNYGIYTSLLSLQTLLIIPSSILTTIIVRFATTYFSKKEEDKASIFYKKMLLVGGIVAFLIFFAVAALSNLILLYLHLKDIRLVLIVAVTIAFSYLGAVNRAFLRSLMKFSYIAFTNLAGNLSRIVLGGVLVLLGFSVSGALVGVMVVPLTIFLLGFLPLVFLLKKHTNNKKIRMDTREILSYGIPASIGLISLSSFISSDVILVKHFFSPVLAGYYGGLSIIGKAIFYFTGSISLVMFPLIVKRYTKGENYKNVYFLSLFLVALPSIAVAVFYFLFPRFSVNFFLGGKEFLNIVPYLGLYGLFITVFILLNITISFLLSLKKTVIAYLVAFFAFFQIVLIYIFHSNFYQIIYVSLFCVSSLLILLWIYWITIEMVESRTLFNKIRLYLNKNSFLYRKLRDFYLEWCFSFLYKIAYFKNFKRKVALFYPEKPRPWSTLFKSFHLLGYKITSDLTQKASVVINYEDKTFGTTDATLKKLTKIRYVINANCKDISKEKVEKVFKVVFGYGLLINPTTYKDRYLKKSNLNTMHDGIILNKPEKPTKGYVYQKLINNETEKKGIFLDLRVPYILGKIPLVYLKYRPFKSRFSTYFDARVDSPEIIFSKNEIIQIKKFCKLMGLDYGELDILRDNDDKKLYIVDVNNTPSGPPHHMRKEDSMKALTITSETLFKEIQSKKYGNKID